MHEECEFRINLEFADRLFRPDEGKMLPPIVQKIRLSTTDPRYFEVGRLAEEIRIQNNKPFFFGWKYYRKYTAEELASAELFYLNITAKFGPAGEECGTIYDESTGCPLCHSGEQQMTPLTLTCKQIPKTREPCSTIADECIISERLSNLFKSEGITGLHLRQVFDSTTKKNCKWYQIIALPTASLSSRTILGDAPF
jgi:hypothetical protein